MVSRNTSLFTFAGVGIVILIAVLAVNPAAAMQEMSDQAAAQVIVTWVQGKLVGSDCPHACCVCNAGENCNYAKASPNLTQDCDTNQSGDTCRVDSRYRVCGTWYWYDNTNTDGACLPPSGNLRIYRQKLNDVGILASYYTIHDPC